MRVVGLGTRSSMRATAAPFARTVPPRGRRARGDPAHRDEREVGLELVQPLDGRFVERRTLAVLALQGEVPDAHIDEWARHLDEGHDPPALVLGQRSSAGNQWRHGSLRRGRRERPVLLAVDAHRRADYPLERKAAVGGGPRRRARPRVGWTSSGSQPWCRRPVRVARVSASETAPGVDGSDGAADGLRDGVGRGVGVSSGHGSSVGGRRAVRSIGGDAHRGTKRRRHGENRRHREGQRATRPMGQAGRPVRNGVSTRPSCRWPRGRTGQPGQDRSRSSPRGRGRWAPARGSASGRGTASS